MSKIKSVLWDGCSIAKYAHLKLDGNYTRITKTQDGNVRCYSSLGTDLTYQIDKCKPRWLVNLHKNMPLGGTILGEMFYYDVKERKGCPASFIKTGLAESINYFNTKSPIIDKRMLGGNRKTKIVCQHTKQLCFSAFAIYEGLDNINNNSPLEDVQSEILKLGVPFAPFIKCDAFIHDGIEGTFFKRFSREELLGWHLETMRARSDVKALCEGFVLKDGNLVNWRKVKKENTMDVFIIGYEHGLGKYRGKVGSLICAVHNLCGKQIPICKVSGFSDEIRDWLTDMFFNFREQIINQVIEVQYQLIGSKGRLRHPRFKDFRDDKLFSECTTEQDPDLFQHWG